MTRRLGDGPPYEVYALFSVTAYDGSELIGIYTTEIAAKTAGVVYAGSQNHQCRTWSISPSSGIWTMDPRSGYNPYMELHRVEVDAPPKVQVCI